MDFLEKQEEQKRHNERHTVLYDLYWSRNNLPETKVCWHENIEDINLSLQRDSLNAKLLAEGVSIINRVPIENLLNEFTNEDAAMFRKKELYNESFYDRSISEIWDHWIWRRPLIPPTIVIFDQDYIDLVCPRGIPSTEMKPVDGKHRINVAYYFNARFIPILVLNSQADFIKSKLSF